MGERYVQRDAKHTPHFSLKGFCDCSVSICAHKWSTGPFLSILTSKNQIHETAARFVKNNG